MSPTHRNNGDGLLQSRTQGSATSFLWDPMTSPSRLLMVGSDKLVYGLGALYVAKSDGTTLTFARDGGKLLAARRGHRMARWIRVWHWPRS